MSGPRNENVGRYSRWPPEKSTRRRSGEPRGKVARGEVLSKVICLMRSLRGEGSWLDNCAGECSRSQCFTRYGVGVKYAVCPPYSPNTLGVAQTREATWWKAGKPGLFGVRSVSINVSVI